VGVPAQQVARRRPCGGGVAQRRGGNARRLPTDYNWAQYGATGTLIPMNDVINRVTAIPLPRRPLTVMNLGSISGGISYHNIARETTLRFELRGESAAILDEVESKLRDIAQEVGATSGTQVTLDVFARREPGGVDIGHPLVQTARAIQTALGLCPMLYATTSPMSALAARSIPALTLGLTTGERRNDLDEIDETVATAPLAAGLAQVAAVLQAMDEGLCHEH
jgi:acetylornithine deacetylase/succinyl-diaminopimelate desuccinylase-like protein